MPDLISEADTREDIAARLKALRTALGMSQTQMAEYVGLASQQAWQNYESNKRPLDPEVAITLAQRTHAPLDWIYRGLTAMIPLHLAEKLSAEVPPRPVRKRRSA